MLKQNKNSVYSFFSLLLAVIGYVIFEKLITSDFPVSENSFTDKVDWFIYSVSNHQWEFASIDIIFFSLLAVPFIFLASSTFFGIKALKDKETISSKMRMLGLISFTISSFVLLTFIIVYAFLM
jgi:hypothetical protein